MILPLNWLKSRALTPENLIDSLSPRLGGYTTPTGMLPFGAEIETLRGMGSKSLKGQHRLIQLLCFSKYNSSGI